MRTIAVCISLWVLTGQVQAQAETGIKQYKLDFFDLYVVKIKVNRYCYSGSDNCVYRKGMKCSLYGVDVLDVLYRPGVTGPDSAGMAAIKNMKYLLAPEKYADSFRNGSVYLVTTRPTTSGRYMGLSRLLDISLQTGCTYYHRDAFLTSLVSCGDKHKDPFDAYIRRKEGRYIAQK